MDNDDAQQRARHLLALVLDGLRPPQDARHDAEPS
jgi:hypothetical protein